jgi:hypothetical protein
MTRNVFSRLHDLTRSIGAIARHKLLRRVLLSILCTTLILSVPQVSLAAGDEDAGKKQTPVQIVIQIVASVVILKLVEPWIMPK